MIPLVSHQKRFRHFQLFNVDLSREGGGGGVEATECAGNNVPQPKNK